MKNTIRLFTLGFLLLTQFSVFAQQQSRKQQPGPEAKAKRQTAEMKVRLNLDDDQTYKVYDVLLNREKEMAQQKDKAKQKNRSHLSKIESILNEDQKKEFKKMQEEKRAQVKARREMQSSLQKDEGKTKNE